MFRRLGRHIRDGFIGVKRHFGMAISSASAITITLLLVGTFTALALNVATLTREIESNISLIALIDYGVTDKATINTMQKQIESIEGVDKAVYRTKDEEFDFYNQTYPEMIEFSELYREDNPFHDTFVVYMQENASLESIKNNVSRINGIDSVEDGGTNTYTLINILETVRTAGLGLIIALIALAVYLIYNTIKITIGSRKDEIAIMRNVGAKNSYIRAPFLVEGIIIGIIGSILPIAGVIYGYYYIYNMTGGVLAGVLSLIAVYPFALYLGLFLLGIGILVGFIGSYISVCKYLGLTR